MSTYRRKTGLIRKLLSFTILGFLIVVVVGPVLAVVGSILFFTLVGAAAWGTYHLSRHLLNTRRECLRDHPRRMAPPSLTPRSIPVVSPSATHCSQHRCNTLRRLSVVLVEVICGALVGGGLGVIAGLQRPDAAEWFVTGGAAAGAVLGFFAGRSAPDTAPDAGTASS